MRSEQVRKNQKSDFCSSPHKNHDDPIIDKTVYRTVQIVRNYIEKYSISDIKENETKKQLIITSASYKSDFSSSDLNRVDLLKKEAIEENFLENVEALKQEELEPEYLDDCLDDFLPIQDCSEIKIGSQDNDNDNNDNDDDDDADDDDFKEENINSEGENVIIEYEYYDEDSEASYDNPRSASESASDSKRSSNPRRPRRPENWACNKRKTLRNSGQTYLNSKGKIVQAKQMRESCGSSCRSKCITKISEVDRQRAFDIYWGFGNVVKQRKFVYKHITSAEPKRRRTENSNRTVTLQFYLDAKDEDGSLMSVQVCKKMFKNTLVISSQVIQGVVKKYALEGFNDTRGKFERKLTTAQKFAIEHVKKFPFFYIEQTMTKVQCYQMYREECLEMGVEPVKEGNYRDIFDKQNQGSFLKTEKISCENCHRYYKATDAERIDLQKEHDNHISLGSNKKCRDRALGRIRHQRAQERKKAQRMQEHQFVLTSD